VEGPPGTGKSQTITNLIAAALTAGKTVLFVSEKLAALEVVRRRLDVAGLGVFCLELHSHKTQKRKLLDDIQQRIDARLSDPHGLEHLVADAKDRRNRLKRYVEVINSVLDNQLGLTVHQVLWKAEKHRTALGGIAANLSHLEFPEASKVLPADLSRSEESVRQFARHLSNVGDCGSSHPWHGYSLHKLVYGDERAAEELLIRIIEATKAYQEQHKRTQIIIGVSVPETREPINMLSEQVAKVPSLDGDEATELLPALYSKPRVEAIKELAERIQHVNERLPILAGALRDHEKISLEQFEQAGKALEKAKALNHAAINHQELLHRGVELHRLHDAMIQSLRYFTEVPPF